MAGTKTKKTIWKFQIEARSYNRIEMPVGATILSAQYQENTESLCVWALVNPNARGKKVRVIRVIGTGHEVESGLKFIGTVQLDKGETVVHVFEQKTE